MNLLRSEYRPDGIFSKLLADDGTVLAHTLEHSYAQLDGSWKPKVPEGVYTCVRGMHQLKGMSHPFETFEITGVPGHTNILFHAGNFDKDSEGCVLLGKAEVSQADGSHMVTASQDTFKAFMARMNGINSFQLTVV